MKMFSDCSGECCVCVGFKYGCLAGYGDDDFVLASKDELLNRLTNSNINETSRNTIIDTLDKVYNVIV